VLTAIGRKYDQYLDFCQQDAHEFLRQLLDAIRMEELDVS
jgi:ubiquitin carboxyl-terminal hydrolase 16/45